MKKLILILAVVGMLMGCTNNMTMTGGDSSSGTSGPSGSNTGNDQSTENAVPQAVAK